jgi:hypothetical protein
MDSPAPHHSRYREKLRLWGLLLAVAAFHAATLRPGHKWGDDFAMYLLHARNLAEGLPYAATGYVFNPAEPLLGPPVYPPVFPLLLAPVWAVFGLNLTAGKALVLVTFVLFLALVYTILAPYLAPRWRWAAVALLGAHPYFWDFKDSILSDVPALLFGVCAIWLAQTGLPSGSWFKAVLLGLSIIAAVGTRNAAVVLLPALFIYELAVRRCLSRFPWIAAAVAGVGLVTLWQTASTTALPLFHLTPGWLVSNILNYAKALRTFWLNGYSHPLSYALFGASGLLALWGLWARRRSAGFFDVYILLHVGLILSYSVPGDFRFLLPALPLYVAYLLAGVEQAAAALAPRWRTPALTAAAAAVALTYAGLYSRQNWGPIREGLGDPDFVSMGRYIQANTEPGAVVAFRKPRILALASGHPSAVYPTTGTPTELAEFLRTFRPRYALVAAVPHQDFDPDRTVWQPYLNRPETGAVPVHQAGPYTLYRLPEP